MRVCVCVRVCLYVRVCTGSTTTMKRSSIAPPQTFTVYKAVLGLSGSGCVRPKRFKLYEATRFP